MKNLILDSQVLNSIQNCAYKTDLSFNRNLRPLHTAEALESGDLLHVFLKVLYTLKLDHPEMPTDAQIDLCCKVARQYAMELSQQIETSEEVIYHATAYAEFYAGELWSPISVEKPFTFVLGELPAYEYRIVYQGVVDLVVNNGKGQTIAVDHKSSRRNADPTYLSLSNQFMGYCLSLGLNDFVVNKVGFQKTLKPQERFLRHYINYTQEQLEEWKENTLWWAQQLIFFIETDTWPKNFTSCDKYSGCVYNKICNSAPDIREHFIQMEYQEGKAWEPMEKDARLDKILAEVMGQ